MGVMGPGMFGFGITVATEREQGLLKLKRALPTPPGATLLAKMLMSMLFVAIIMASMAAVAPLGHAHLSAGRMLGLALVGIVGSMPFVFHNLEAEMVERAAHLVELVLGFDDDLVETLRDRPHFLLLGESAEMTLAAPVAACPANPGVKNPAARKHDLFAQPVHEVD